MVSMVLSIYGHTCHVATTGREGLRVAESVLPELAILDIGLPDLSGYEVAQALRVRFGTDIYLVALTGWGQHDDRAKAFAAGFDKHLLKPADAAMLLEVVAARGG